MLRPAAGVPERMSRMKKPAIFILSILLALSVLPACSSPRPGDPGVKTTPAPEATEAPVTEVPVTEVPETEVPVTEVPVTAPPETEPPVDYGALLDEVLPFSQSEVRRIVEACGRSDILR